MSGYFDALMRSSGMTIGRPGLAPAKLEATALDVDLDHMANAEPTARHPVSTTDQPPAPGVSEVVDLTVPQPVPRSLDRHTHDELPGAPAHSRSAPEGAVEPGKPPVESAKPDLGEALVRAAMRWVAAGTPQVGPVTDVSDGAQGVARLQPILRPALERTSSLATTEPAADEDDGQSASLNKAPATPAPSALPLSESIAATPQPFRAPLVPAALLPQTAPPVRDEVVEVSIGAIHVRVDAPPAQTVARPASTPAAGAPVAATARPARSGLSRRALRRI